MEVWPEGKEAHPSMMLMAPQANERTAIVRTNDGNRFLLGEQWGDTRLGVNGNTSIWNFVFELSLVPPKVTRPWKVLKITYGLSFLTGRPRT